MNLFLENKHLTKYSAFKFWSVYGITFIEKDKLFDWISGLHCEIVCTFPYSTFGKVIFDQEENTSSATFTTFT
jgi:uncharacterized membrane protein